MRMAPSDAGELGCGLDRTAFLEPIEEVTFPRLVKARTLGLRIELNLRRLWSVARPAGFLETAQQAFGTTARQNMYEVLRWTPDLHAGAVIGGRYERIEPGLSLVVIDIDGLRRTLPEIALDWLGRFRRLVISRQGRTEPGIALALSLDHRLFAEGQVPDGLAAGIGKRSTTTARVSKPRLERFQLDASRLQAPNGLGISRPE